MVGYAVAGLGLILSCSYAPPVVWTSEIRGMNTSAPNTVTSPSSVYSGGGGEIKSPDRQEPLGGNVLGNRTRSVRRAGEYVLPVNDDRGRTAAAIIGKVLGARHHPRRRRRSVGRSCHRDANGIINMGSGDADAPAP